ncbi:MAG TPA: ABC transporter ATP-binding protein, partial [Polyangiaceae bacterium]|nr:ABC transporter ATP-binding protein [Polyangiaceae bacterium]
MTAANPALDDFELIARYTDQPPRLPPDQRAAMVHASSEEPIAYALVDLDSSLHLTESWLALTPRFVVLVAAGAAPIARPRSALAACSVEPGLSCNTLRIEFDASLAPGLHACPPLLARYTQRQRSAVEKLVAALEGDTPADAPATPADADRSYAAEVVRPLRNAQALVSRSGLFIIARLLRYLLPYRRQLILGLGAAALITLCMLLPPYLTGYLIDGVLRPVQAGAISSESAARLGWLCVGAMTAVYVLRRAAAWTRLRLMAVLGELVARDLREELYGHLQKLSISFYSRKKTGSLITRVSSDTDRLWDFLAFGVVDLSLSVVLLLGLCSVLISLDPALGLLMALPLPAIVLAIRANGKRMERLFTRAFRRWSNLTDVLSDTIPGIRVVRAFNQHAREARRFGDANDAATADFNRIHGVWTSFWPGVMLVVELSIVLVWAFALPRLLGGRFLGPPMSIGTFVSFLLYTGMFMWPIEVVGQMARIVNRATTSAQRVFEVLDTRPEVVDAAEPLPVSTLEGHVRFENVSFSYDQVRPTLRHISFEVRAGETIGLVGPSGGGKSTLVNLLPRFYEMQEGTILLDGIDTRTLTLKNLRQQFALVSQEVILFNDTVFNNIAYGDLRTTPEEKVIAAAKAAYAWEFIQNLPNGLQTEIGDRGVRLSGGQRQRLAIARAILKDAPI